jgi:hypothetical protein
MQAVSHLLDISSIYNCLCQVMPLCWRVHVWIAVQVHLPHLQRQCALLAYIAAAAV